MTTTAFIYALFSSDTGEIRYVGKAKNLRRRLSGHIHEAKKKPSQSHRTKWITSLLKTGAHPGILALREVPESEWQEAEREEIAKYSSHGCLVNGTSGGEGVEMTPEIRAKIGDVKRGRKQGPLSPEHRAKISAANRGKKKGPRSPEHCAKLSEAKRGKKLSPEHCAKLAEVRRGKKRRPFSPEHCAKLSEAHRQRHARERAQRERLQELSQ